MLAISFFGTFEKFQSLLGKSSNLLPRCGHSSPGNSKPYRACVCIEVQTLWPSKKQKRFQDTNAKPLRLTTSQISSLSHSWIEENFLPEMPHPSHCTWIALAIRAVCEMWCLAVVFCSFNSTKIQVGKKNILHIQAFNGFLKCMTWGLLRSWRTDFKSPTVFNPYFQHHWKCLKTVKVIHLEMNLGILTIRCVFSCVLNVQHRVYQNNLLATQIFRICRLVFGLPPRARFERF